MLREGLSSDHEFVKPTWLNGFYYGNDWVRLIPKGIYFRNYRKVLEVVLSRPSVQVRVACLPDDPDVILGYSVLEAGAMRAVLHWIHVKEAWRRLGIAKSLVPQGITEVTHMTKVGKSLKPFHWKYNPFLI